MCVQRFIVLGYVLAAVGNFDYLGYVFAVVGIFGHLGGLGTSGISCVNTWH